jgi:hypothetical protein
MSQPADAMVPAKLNVVAAFNQVNPNNAAKFQIQQPSAVKMPSGAENSSTYHQQGIQKTDQGAFIVSGSATSQGYFYIVDSNNTIVSLLTVPDTFQKNHFNHMGGCQQFLNVLAVGCENYNAGKTGTSVVLFYDVHDIYNPALLPTMIERNESGLTAGEVAITLYDNRWLVVVGNYDCNSLTFYQTPGGNLSAGFQPFAVWNSSSGFAPGSIDKNWGAYQNINLFVDADGTLYLIGMHSEGAENKDWADLYKVVLTPGTPYTAALTKVANKHFYRNGDGPRFDYGSGFYPNPQTGSFEVYACSAHIDKIDGKNVSRCNQWSPYPA